MSELTEAMVAWAAVVGAQNVSRDPRLLAEVQSATFASDRRVLAVLSPGTVEEVQECVRVAARFKLPLYPVSRGKNWGYGSRVPSVDQSVLLDLGRLNRIVEFNEELAYITVEPGVTMEQAARFLQERGSALQVPLTGSHPESSLLGNALERGIALGPYADRFLHTGGLEAVLGNGERVQSGFHAYSGAQAAHVHRWGVGPVLDGLFTQSNLGIVTRLTVLLTRRPRTLHFVYLGVETPEAFLQTVDALRTLLLDDAIPCGFNLHSAAHLRAMVIGGHTGAKPPEKIPAWRAFIPLLVSGEAEGKERWATVERALRPVVTTLHYLDGAQRSMAREDPKTFERQTGLSAQSVVGYASLFDGVPNTSYLGVPYSRKKSRGPESDLDRDRCGLIFYAPVLPMVGRVVAEAAETISAIMREHELDPILTVKFSGQRFVEILTWIVYDRDVPGMDERAKACHDKLFRTLADRGILPYRVGLQGMELLPAPSEGTLRLLRDLKQTLDPHDVIAPGRYDGRVHWNSLFSSEE